MIYDTRRIHQSLVNARMLLWMNTKREGRINEISKTMATKNRPLGWTTIEESKALIKAGLNSNTADMYWSDWKRMTDSIAYPHCGIASKGDLPCWSLGALWKHLPQYTEGYGLEAYRNGDNKEIICYWCEDYIEDLQTYCSDYQIESVVKMVLWCLSNGYIKK